MGNLKDYATSTILVAPSPATSGTTLEVQLGHGDRFPAAPFHVTAHPPSEFPTLDNAEKLLVTAKTDNEFTITRAQGDTDAQPIEAGWRISNTLFLDDIPVIDATSVESAGAVMETDTSTADMDFVLDEDDMASDSATKLATQQSIKAYVDSAIADAVADAKEALYPVGSIYTNEGDSTNPATLLGFGTWTAFSVGRVLVGYNSADTDFDTSGKTGGLKETRHGFLEWGLNSSKFQDSGSNYISSATNDLNSWLSGGGSSSVSHSVAVRSLGGTIRTQNTNATEVRHGRYTTTNLQPYTVVYMWKRTA